MCFSTHCLLIGRGSLIDLAIAELNPSVQISVLHHGAELRNVSTLGVLCAPLVLVRNRGI